MAFLEDGFGNSLCIGRH